jgi:hypothetical protein
VAPGVYLRDGVEIEFASGERIVCDGVPKGLLTVIIWLILRVKLLPLSLPLHLHLFASQSVSQRKLPIQQLI